MATNIVGFCTFSTKVSYNICLEKKRSKTGNLINLA